MEWTSETNTKYKFVYTTEFWRTDRIIDLMCSTPLEYSKKGEKSSTHTSIGKQKKKEKKKLNKFNRTQTFHQIVATTLSHLQIFVFSRQIETKINVNVQGIDNFKTNISTIAFYRWIGADSDTKSIKYLICVLKWHMLKSSLIGIFILIFGHRSYGERLRYLHRCRQSLFSIHS